MEHLPLKHSLLSNLHILYSWNHLIRQCTVWMTFGTQVSWRTESLVSFSRFLATGFSTSYQLTPTLRCMGPSLGLLWTHGRQTLSAFHVPAIPSLLSLRFSSIVISASLHGCSMFPTVSSKSFQHIFQVLHSITTIFGSVSFTIFSIGHVSWNA